MSKQQILIATHNPSKVERLQKFVNSSQFELLSPNTFSKSVPKVIENGEDEKANAKIKAEGYFEVFQTPCLSLDTGFYLDDLPLQKQPGKHAQRVAGVTEDDSDENRYQKMLKYYLNLANSFGGKASGYFKDVFCLKMTDKILFQTAIRPVILTNKVYKKDVHLPISSLYLVPPFFKNYHELSNLEMQKFVESTVKAVNEILERV